MTQIFLPNLLTDQQLEEKHPLSEIFPVAPPASLFLSRLQEELGVWYLTEIGSDLLARQKADTLQAIVLPFSLSATMEEMAMANGIELPISIAIDAHPSETTEFVEQVFNWVSQQPKPITITTSGWGQLEEALLIKAGKEKVSISLSQTAAKLGETIRISKMLNDKSWLVGIAAELKLKFPATETVSARELCLRSSARVESLPHQGLLKYVHSSGGGGVMEFDSKFQALILRASREAPSVLDSKWLLQNKINVAKEFSVVVDADWTEVIQVEYAENHLSNIHRPISRGSDEEVCETLLGVANILREKVKAAGWIAPFGFDAILDVEGTLYPAIDLNVRLTKGHFLLAAVRRFQSISRERNLFHADKWKVIRHRHRMKPFSSETEFRNSDFYRRHIKSDDKTIRFLLGCSGMLPGPAADRNVCECTVLEFDRFQERG